MTNKWYSLGKQNGITCSNCNSIHKNIGVLDHHSTICPECKIECVWYDLGNNKVIQIIPSLAPNQFIKFIKWSQQELDELEFLELLVTFEELNKAI